MLARHMFSPSQRVVFVTGKGGVGKSTVAAALARAEADRAGAAVLVEFEAATAAERSLGDEAERVRVVIIEYLDALLAAISRMASSRLLARIVVQQRALARVLRAVPAIRELVALERVRALVSESPARVFVDLPATGHAVDWLRVPAAAERFLRVGPAARMCRDILDEVIASGKSALVVVSTAEPMVASETRELCARIGSELGRSPELVVANRVPAAIPAAALAQARSRAGQGPDFAALAEALQSQSELRAEADAALRELAEISGARVVEVRELGRDPTPRQFARLIGATG
jgi:arsenite/tail-anchored protein-transporting ATPase